jgi:molybdate transport system substrate-binding protein
MPLAHRILAGCTPARITFARRRARTIVPHMRRREFLIGSSLALGFALPVLAQGGTILVFAAASLKDALDAIDADWRKESGRRATISYAASSALAKQIEAGAPADVFISADLDWMD